MVAIIYDRLRSDILSGRLAADEPISQLSIAGEYGISRGPVRSAMNRLESEQLIVGRANKRFVVAPLDILDLEMVLSLNVANMALAIRVSVPKMDQFDIAALQQACRDMAATIETDLLAWEAAYRAFALRLIVHAGERAAALIAGLLDFLQRYRASELKRLPTVYAGGDEPEGMIEAAIARDGVRAAALYVEYMGRISSLILANAAPLHDAERLRTYITALSPEAANAQRKPAKKTQSSKRSEGTDA